MSYPTIDMNKVSEALNESMFASRPSIPTLSRVPSFTYPLTRVHARSEMLPPPPSPTLILVREEAVNVAHGKVKNTFRFNNLSENPTLDLPSWTHIPRLCLPAGVDPDEDEDAEDWGLNLFSLAVRTVDSVEIIRRNTDEKKLRVESCTSRNSKTVIKDAMRSVERMVKNSVVGLFRRFSS